MQLSLSLSLLLTRLSIRSFVRSFFFLPCPLISFVLFVSPFIFAPEQTRWRRIEIESSERRLACVELREPQPILFIHTDTQRQTLLSIHPPIYRNIWGNDARGNRSRPVFRSFCTRFPLVVVVVIVRIDRWLCHAFVRLIVFPFANLSSKSYISTLFLIEGIFKSSVESMAVRMCFYHFKYSTRIPQRRR